MTFKDPIVIPTSNSALSNLSNSLTSNSMRPLPSSTSILHHGSKGGSTLGKRQHQEPDENAEVFPEGSHGARPFCNSVVGTAITTTAPTPLSMTPPTAAAPAPASTPAPISTTPSSEASAAAAAASKAEVEQEQASNYSTFFTNAKLKEAEVVAKIVNSYDGWKAFTTSAGRMFIQPPLSERTVTEGKDVLVSLMERADEAGCSEAIVVLPKEGSEGASLLRIFMFLGFAIMPPNFAKHPGNTDFLYLVSEL